jgi:TatD family-associated radical SAM protein
MNQEHTGGKIGEQIFAYPLYGSLYLNITNQCPNACRFCIRNSTGVGYNLWLEHEPSAEEVLAAVGDLKSFREIVFCGYGEPLMRPEVLIQVAAGLKERIQNEGLNIEIRINTNGLADLFLGYDVLPQLKGLINTISISLNAHNAEAYLQITQSNYGLKAFPAILDFTRRSVFFIPKVVLSVVRYPGVNIEEVIQISRNLGAELRIREYMDQ